MSSLVHTAIAATRPSAALGCVAAPLAAATLPPSVLAYLQFVQVQKRLAQRSVANYTHGLKKLCHLCAALSLDVLDVHTQHVRRFAAQLHSLGHSSRGIALTLSSWRGFYAWLGQQGRCTHNPVQGVRAPRGARLLPKALGVDEAVQLAAYRHAPAASAKAPALNMALQARDDAITELLYSCGLRVGELVQLNLTAHSSDSSNAAWIDRQERWVHVLGKGQKRRSVPIGAAALAAIERWLQYRAQNPRNAGQAALFTGQNGSRLSTTAVWQRLQQRSALAGLGLAVHPHMLRHSCASHVLQSSHDLRGVQELLGHQSIASTQVYTRLDFQHLAQVYDVAHPRARRKT